MFVALVRVGDQTCSCDHVGHGRLCKSHVCEPCWIDEPRECVYTIMREDFFTFQQLFEIADL